MPLSLELRVSRRFCFTLVAIHLIALIVALALPPLAPIGLRVLLALLVLVSAGFYLRRDGLLRAADSITRVVWDVDDVWRVQLRSGVVHTAQRRHDTIIWPDILFITLRLDSGRVRTLVLLCDSTAEESLRQLRVRLRIE